MNKSLTGRNKAGTGPARFKAHLERRLTQHALGFDLNQAGRFHPQICLPAACPGTAVVDNSFVWRVGNVEPPARHPRMAQSQQNGRICNAHSPSAVPRINRPNIPETGFNLVQGLKLCGQGWAVGQDKRDSENH